MYFGGQNRMYSYNMGGQMPPFAQQPVYQPGMQIPATPPMSPPMSPPQAPINYGAPTVAPQGVAPAPGAKRKALCIGCNYPGQDAQLFGCANDAYSWARYFKKIGFDEVYLMVDQIPGQGMRQGPPVRKEERYYPGRENILEALENLCSSTNEGDALAITFSGHGTQTFDWKLVREEDFMAEALCPSDFSQRGAFQRPLLKDSVLQKVLKNNCADRVSVTLFFDCCHSGTMLDAQNQRDSTNLPPPTAAGQPVGINPAPWMDPSSRSRNAMPRRAPGLNPRPVFGKMKNPLAGSGVRKYPNIQCFSITGCRDDQTSLDANLAGKQQGALSYCLQEALKQVGPRATYAQLFQAAAGQRDRLKNGVLPMLDQYFQMTWTEHADPDRDTLFVASMTEVPNKKTCGCGGDDDEEVVAPVVPPQPQPQARGLGGYGYAPQPVQYPAYPYAAY